MKCNRVLCAASTAAIVLALSQAYVHGETAPVQGKEPVSLRVSHSDSEAASHFSNFHFHGLSRNGAPKAASDVATLTVRRPNGTASVLNVKGASTPAVVPVPSPGFYPADLTYLGGPVLATTTTHDIYVDGVGSNGADPGIFLTHWRHSQFVHVLDQYVGSTANDRYPAGTAANLEYPIYTTLGDNDLIQMLHAAASAFGTGYGHVYNIFLPQGVDFCEGSECYSPDNLATFFFCAFHGSLDFSDIGHVLFTLEPYQDVQGCQVLPPSPNGTLIDSTASVLSHEMSETITDPDVNPEVVGDAWLAVNSLAVDGDEIGDLCQSFDLNGPYFMNPTSNLDGKDYAIQFEYSNKYHACANVQ